MIDNRVAIANNINIFTCVNQQHLYFMKMRQMHTLYKNIFHNPIALRFFVVVVLLFYVQGKHLRSCRDGQLT